ncbi:protein trachealess [Trichonephila clavata]|uniref:Protein trachealess n=1 Tax=Trichonephila clavata TaxID=2740835 RepID=A0A8X6HKC3_TRICU|nr:protein trachealess [Trichonephila clavata]
MPVVFSVIMPMNDEGGSLRSRSMSSVAIDLFEMHQATHILQSLDGFAFALGADGRFLYISETVSIYLGLSQVEMTGSSVFDYIHQQDQSELADLIGLNMCPSPSATSPPASVASDDGSSSNPGPSTPTGFDRPSPTMQLPNDNAGQSLHRSFCVRMKSTLTKRGCHFKSSGYRVVLVLSHMRPQYNFSASSRKQTPQLMGLVGLAIALPPPSVNELRLESDMFVTRLTFDFRISHCEPRVSELLDYTAEELTGTSMYTLCFASDVNKLRKCHIDCNAAKRTSDECLLQTHEQKRRLHMAPKLRYRHLQLQEHGRGNHYLCQLRAQQSGVPPLCDGLLSTPCIPGPEERRPQQLREGHQSGQRGRQRYCLLPRQRGSLRPYVIFPDNPSAGDVEPEQRSSSRPDHPATSDGNDEGQTYDDGSELDVDGSKRDYLHRVR